MRNLLDGGKMIGSCRQVALFGFMFLLGSLAGCSGGKNTAPVTGKVTTQGKEVNMGTIMFVPKVNIDAKSPGKAAAGIVKPDGSYTLSTYRKGDGAIIGLHKVVFSPPPGTMPPGKEKLEEGESLLKGPLDGLVPQPAEVEVKPGSNTINVELVPAPSQR